MPAFSSPRERRLWFFALAVVVAIYSTLGFAPAISRALRQEGLLGAFFVVAMLLVGATIVTLALEARPGGLEIAVGLGIAAVYLLLFVRMALPEERTHLIEYGVLGAFVYEALIERAHRGRRVPSPALLAILLTSSIGIVDECIQRWLPSRVFDPRDITFNVLASVMAVSSSAALRWARQRGRRRRQP